MLRSRCLTWKPYRAVRTKSHGKKMNLRKKDFLVFADHCEIPRKAAEKKMMMMMMKLVRMQPTFTNMCSEFYLPEHMEESLNELIEARCRGIAG